MLIFSFSFNFISLNRVKKFFVDIMPRVWLKRHTASVYLYATHMIHGTLAVNLTTFIRMLLTVCDGHYLSKFRLLRSPMFLNFISTFIFALFLTTECQNSLKIGPSLAKSLPLWITCADMILIAFHLHPHRAIPYHSFNARD